MNWNLKLLSAGLLVAVLALAGCGGGSDGNMMDDKGNMTTTPTCKAGQALDQSTNTCVETKASADDAAKAAQALYARLGVDAAVPAAVHTKGGATVKDENKRFQSFALQGDKFSMDIGSATPAGTGDSDGAGAAGYYAATFGGDVDSGELKSSDFGTISQKTHDKNVTGKAFYQISGTYKGVNGTIRCRGSCTSKDGKPAGGFWYFKPNDAMARVMGPKVEWGWWLDPSDSAKTTVVNRYIPEEVTQSGLDQLGEGTATYKGDATGIYAVTGDSGAFDAKATLSASFGGGVNPKLSGSIHDFTGADGKARGWTVTLKEDQADGDGAFLGATVWDGNESAGGWGASMHGGSATVMPTHIVGEFNASNQGGRMVGVFGAKP